MKTFKHSNENDEPKRRPDLRTACVGLLGVITIAVAAFSTKISYDLLEPRFGEAAVLIVGAIDTVWAILLAAEYAAGNNKRRALPPRVGGYVLTGIAAAIPTAELLTQQGAIDVAVALTPIAIIVTKLSWILVLDAFGRSASPEMRSQLARRRQEVVDELERMEAEASHHEEVTTVAASLEARISRADAAYRESALRSQAEAASTVSAQARLTDEALGAAEMPALAARIALPVLGEWQPVAASGLSLPAAPAATPAAALPAAAAAAQVSAPAAPSAAPPATPRPAAVEASVPEELERMAAEAGVEVPRPGQDGLSQEQIALVLRHLRAQGRPPLSGREAQAAYRGAGFRGGDAKVRLAWNAIEAQDASASLVAEMQ